MGNYHHTQTPTEGIHVPYNWVFSNYESMMFMASAEAEDVGKIAKLQSDGSLWQLINAAPPLWRDVGSPYGGHVKSFNGRQDAVLPAANDYEVSDIEGLQGALDLKSPVNNPTFTGTVAGVTKTMVGLSEVDNTSDVNKPISTAVQSALNLKAPVDGPAFTGVVTGITKSMIGLGNADDTSDLNKPISTAAQSALDLKAPIDSPAFTGTVTGITKAMVGLSDVTNDAQIPLAQKGAANGVATLDNGGKIPVALLPAGLLNFQGEWDASTNTPTLINGTGTKGDVWECKTAGTRSFGGATFEFKVNDWVVYNGTIWELSINSNIVASVFGRTGAISAQAGDYSASKVSNDSAVTGTYVKDALETLNTAVGTKAPSASPTFTGTVSGVTKAMVGLANADNTSDADKPISTAVQSALNGKAATSHAASHISGGADALSGTLAVNITGSSASCTGNAASATTAGTCTGNAVSATTAGTCTGNAATASSCSGNSATATIATTAYKIRTSAPASPTDGDIWMV